MFRKIVPPARGGIRFLLYAFNALIPHRRRPGKVKSHVHLNILVTGGTGFIGSHTLIELIAEGHSVVVVDNLSNSNPESLRRVESITGQTVPFYRGDIRDREGLGQVFELH